ncbi:MAG: chitobiase/beta-hexosaminidase C-terminal domain-containing protein [Muribaculaceae bacterium]|nr:chitobiase/beta-hexosaminidase C-terminal domain-containing protein [Muribaculaceae bacterium]
MKKQLLALAVAAITTIAGMAQTVAFVADGASYTGTGTKYTLTGTVANNTYTEGDIKIEFVKNNNSSSQVNSKLIRWYQSDEIVVTPLNGVKITSVSFLGVSSTSYGNVAITVNGDSNTKVATGNPTRTYTCESTEAITFKSGAQIRFTALEVSYEAGTPVSVATPVIKFSEGEWCHYATITCETEGAEIYYTLDGTEPTAESEKYTAPIEIYDGKWTVKAVAIKDGESSLVAAETIDIPMKLDDLSGLVGADEAMLQEMGGSVNFEFTGTLTYVYQAGNYLYLTDGTYNVKLFGYDQPRYAAGDTFSSLKGVYSYRYGQPQISNFTLSEAVAGGQVIKPMEIEEADLIAAYNDNKWYTLKGVEIKGVNGKNATMVTADGTEIALYNDFACEGFANGTNLTVSGIVGLYNTNVQFLPTEITNEAGEEVVAAPVFSLANGAYTINSEVELTCETEGATIVYTINGGEAVEAESPVTIVLTEDMTIEAYAKMEGMADSQTVTATYTVKEAEVVDGTTAIFDFSDAIEFAKIECDATYPGSGANTPLNNVEMSMNGVSIVLSKASGSTNPSIYFNGMALRMYKNNTMTISILPGYTIDKITFTNPSGQALPTMAGVYDGVWTRPEVATQSDDNGAVDFVVSANGRIAKIAVDFTKIVDGIEDVKVEDGAAAVYYNLQGVRVENPSNGLYIRVAGKQVSKVYVR